MTAGKTIFCNSGFEAVEAALKTALLATGKPGVIAFEGAYHGLGYGALNVTQRAHFRSPFLSQLREFGHFVPFPKAGQASRLALSALESPAVQEIESRIQRLFRTRAHRRDPGRADPGARRHEYSAAGLPADAAPALR